MTTPSAAVAEALRARYSAPDWAIFFEVPSATGGAAARRADAIAMGLWPSRGLEINGFEIKVDRRDWLRELKDPSKAEEIACFTDRWWIAATPGVVKPEELPAGWGLLLLRDSGLRMEREAPKREGVTMSRSFVASLLRAASKVSPAEQVVQAAVDAALRVERELAKKSIALTTSHTEREAERLRKMVDDFERASGIRLNQWQAGDIGAAVKVLLNGGAEKLRKELAEVGEKADWVARSVAAILESKPAREAKSG
jgi:hypothetical protein